MHSLTIEVCNRVDSEDRRKPRERVKIDFAPRVVNAV